MANQDPMRLPAAAPREIVLVDRLLSASGKRVSGAELASTGRVYRLVDRGALVGQLLQLVDAFVEERVRQVERDMARLLDSREKEAFTDGQNRTLTSLAALADLVDGVVASVPGGEQNIALRALSRRIDSIFRTYGYSRIETAGKLFDSRVHEMVEERIQEGIAPGTIIEEVSRGYANGSFVLQVARVVVAGNNSGLNISTKESG
jgi:molecular chaperone GrpE (heat shock protein)